MSIAGSVSAVARHSAVRFLIVGGLSITADAGSLYVLHGIAGMWLPAATAISYLISLGLNFTLNRYWSFGAEGSVMKHAGRYLALVSGNLILNVILVQSLVLAGVLYLVAKLMVTAVLSTANYFVSRWWIFA